MHSWILGIHDPIWKKVFSEEQFRTILNKNNKKLPDLPRDVNIMFDGFAAIFKYAKTRKEKSSSPTSPMTSEEEDDLIDSLEDVVTKNGLAKGRKNSDLCWFQTTILHVVDLYLWKVINCVKECGSEMDFTAKIWALLNRIFYSIMVDPYRVC